MSKTILWFPTLCLTALCFTALGLHSGPLPAQEVAAEHSVRVEDPGEASDFGLDVRAVTLESDGTVLTVRVEVDRDIAEYTKAEGPGDVLSLLIDVDNDASTGGESFRGSAGLEFSAKIYVCKSFEGGEVCAGDIKGPKVTGYYSRYEPSVWSAEKEDFEEIHDFFQWEGGKEDLDGATLVSKIPYSEIGAEPGQQIRIHFEGAGLERTELPVVLLTLR